MEELLAKIESQIQETLASSRKFSTGDPRYVELFWTGVGLQTAKSIVEKDRLSTEKCHWTVKFMEPYAWSSEEVIMEYNYNFVLLTSDEAKAKADIDFGKDTAKIITRMASIGE